MSKKNSILGLSEAEKRDIFFILITFKISCSAELSIIFFITSRPVYCLPSHLLLFLSTALQLILVQGIGYPPSHVTVSRTARSSIMDGPRDNFMFLPGFPYK